MPGKTCRDFSQGVRKPIVHKSDKGGPFPEDAASLKCSSEPKSRGLNNVLKLLGCAGQINGSALAKWGKNSTGYRNYDGADLY